MPEVKDLEKDEQDKFWSLFTLVIKAVAPEDPTGHMPNCGYTNDNPDCNCMDFGARLHRALVTEIVSWRDS